MKQFVRALVNGLVIPILCATTFFLCASTDSQAPPAIPQVDGLKLQRLEAREIKDTGDYSGEVTFDVPAAAVSAVVHCGGFGDDALGLVWTLTDPNGKEVWNGDREDELTAAGFRPTTTEDTVVALLPLSPREPLIPGTYTINFWIGEDNLGTAECGVIIRDTPVKDKNTMAIEVVFVGLDGVDAEHPYGNKAIKQFEKALRKDFKSADVDLKITYKDYDGPALDVYSVIDVRGDDMSEMHNLFRQAAPEDPKAITMFLVQEISNAEGGATILGVSAGPPGLPIWPNTSKSAVVVGAVDLLKQPEIVARVAAHELGHFLGLFHTTEKNASAHDLVQDTPECHDKHDSDGNEVMTNSECERLSSHQNVMWWTLSSPKAKFSDEQKWILDRSVVMQ